MSTEINKTDGSHLATVSDLTVDVSSSPITLIGYGYPYFPKAVNENMIALLENFSNDAAPSHPLTGMLWYNADTDVKNVSFYDGTRWIPLSSQTNSAMAELNRLSTANNIDLVTASSVAIHTAGDDTRSLVTSIMIIPRTGAAPTGAPAVIKLEVSSGTADVSEAIVLTGLTSAAKFSLYFIEGVNRIVQAGETVNLSVVTKAHGVLACDVYLFGKVL